MCDLRISPFHLFILCSGNSMATRLHLKIPVIGRFCQYLHFHFVWVSMIAPFLTHISIFTHCQYLHLHGMWVSAIVPSCLFKYRVLVQILGTLCTLTKVRNTFFLCPCLALHIFAFLVYHEIKIWSISNFVATQLCKPSPGLKHVSVLHMSNTVPTFFWWNIFLWWNLNS